MKRFSIAAALVALAIAVPLGIGSSHREAPLTALDPTGDDTDVYAFTAKDDPNTSRNEEEFLTVVGNWIPFEDPAGGPNFYRFDDRAHYYINIDNDGNGEADIRYRFEFDTDVRDGNTFLYAKPQVTSFNDPDLNIAQTYDIVRESDEDRDRKIANNLPVAPNNVGPKTMPDYGALADEAIKNVDFPGGTGRVFTGQRDDPFFVDLGATFDALNIRVLTGDKGQGKDDVAGYSVHAIVMQIPEGDLIGRNGGGDDDGDDDDRDDDDRDDDDRDDDDRDNDDRDNDDRDDDDRDDDRDDEDRDDDDREARSSSNGDSVVGVWASTERRELQVTNRDREGKGDYVQVSRLGNPLVNEVVIPLGQKDRFNRHSPRGDADRFGQFVVEPELARLLNALFGLGVKETDRTDIVLALLQGIPGLNQQSGKPVDTLKINLDTPPSATEGRFGALPNAATGFPAGDPAGFPNGRRLADDVVDIELRVVAGHLLPASDPKRNTTPLGDGVDQNDKPFLDRFPYLAAPTSGFNAQLKCDRTPPGPNGQGCAVLDPPHPSQ
jgi:Domain of unknown function (DUF4331)